MEFVRKHKLALSVSASIIGLGLYLLQCVRSVPAEPKQDPADPQECPKQQLAEQAPSVGKNERELPDTDESPCRFGYACMRRDTCQYQHPPDQPAVPGQRQPLGALWRFPSDHLPVACVLEDGLVCLPTTTCSGTRAAQLLCVLYMLSMGVD